jgi:hypothetical protein
MNRVIAALLVVVGFILIGVSGKLAAQGRIEGRYLCSSTNGRFAYVWLFNRAGYVRLLVDTIDATPSRPVPYTIKGDSITITITDKTTWRAELQTAIEPNDAMVFSNAPMVACSK